MRGFYKVTWMVWFLRIIGWLLMSGVFPVQKLPPPQCEVARALQLLMCSEYSLCFYVIAKCQF